MAPTAELSLLITPPTPSPSPLHPSSSLHLSPSIDHFIHSPTHPAPHHPSPFVRLSCRLFLLPSFHSSVRLCIRPCVHRSCLLPHLYLSFISLSLNYSFLELTAYHLLSPSVSLPNADGCRLSAPPPAAPPSPSPLFIISLLHSFPNSIFSLLAFLFWFLSSVTLRYTELGRLLS